MLPFFFTLTAFMVFAVIFISVRRRRAFRESVTKAGADGVESVSDPANEIEFTVSMEELSAILKALPEVEISVQSLPPQAVLPDSDEDESDTDEGVVPPQIEDDDQIGGGVGIVIEYEDAKGNVTTRRIRIDGRYENAQGDDVLKAWCYERKAARNFLIYRINSAYDPETGEVYEDHEEEIYKMTAHLVIDAPKRKTRKKRDYPVITDFQKAYDACYRGIKILVYIARVDGHYHPEEREVIARWCADVCEGGDEVLDWDPDVFMAYADRQYPSFVNFEKCLRMEMDFWNSRLRHILKASLKLIVADGVIVSSETGAVAVIEEFIARAEACSEENRRRRQSEGVTYEIVLDVAAAVPPKSSFNDFSSEN